MIFNRIKLNYNIKLLDDLFNEKNYPKIHLQLDSLKKERKIFFDISKYIYQRYLLLNQHQDFHKSKFIWTISYDLDDVSFLNDFLSFYMSKQQSVNSTFDSLRGAMDKLINEYGNDKFPNHPSFEDIIINSGLYQQQILFNANTDFVFLKSNSAFFEATNNNFFIYPNNTTAFIYIIKDPIKLYSKCKLLNDNSQESLNKIINVVDDEYLKDSKYFFYENWQNWSINAKSWNDENVKNTYRGKIIKYEDLVYHPFETLIEIIYHLKQSGANIAIDHKIIEDFLNSYTNPSEETNVQVSQKEKKSVYNNVDKDLLLEFQYNLDD